MKTFKDLEKCQMGGEWRATLFQHVQPGTIVRRDQWSAPFIVDIVLEAPVENARMYWIKKIDGSKDRIIYPDTTTCLMWFDNEEWEAVSASAFEAAREELRRMSWQ